VAGANKRLVLSGTATTEGLMTRSADGRYLIVAGYDANTGVASVTTSAATTTNRVIGRIDAAGLIDTTTGLTDSTGNPRGATSTNGTTLWITGNNNGVRATTLGATTSTQLSTTPTNLRGVAVYPGYGAFPSPQLYISTSSGAFQGPATVGSGTPTTSGQTTVLLPGFPTAAGPSAYAFFFADLSASVAGVDTVYVADDRASPNGGIQKWSYDGTTWTLTGTTGLSSARGLIGTVSGTTVTLYVTDGGTLRKITDTAGHNAANNGTLSTLASAGTNKAFRGVALTPVGPPAVVSSNRVSASPTNATAVSFTVTFDQDVTGVDNADFTPTNTGGSTTGTVSTVTPVDAHTYTVAVNLGGGDGSIKLNVTDDNSITAVATGLQLGGPAAGDGNFTTGQSYQIDRTAPVVQSSTRNDTNPTTAASVNFTVTFSEPVSGVDTGDFSLTTSGLSGASVTNVIGGPSAYTVTVSTGTGNGTLRLDVAANGSISDAAGNLLAAAFTAGETYDVDRNITTVQSIVRASGTNPTNATTLSYTVTFTAAVNGVDPSDFTTTTTGTIAGATVSNVTPVNGSTYTVDVTVTGGQGTVRLDLVDNDSITNAGNGIPLGGAGSGNGNFNTGETYSVDLVAPTVQSFVRVGSSPTNAATVNYTLTFNEAVSGVDSADFTLTTSGGSTVGTPTSGDGGTTWTVPITTGGPTDSIAIKVSDNDTIIDAVGNPLGGSGSGNGDFTSPDTTDVDKVAPVVSSITRASADPSGGPTVDFTVLFSKAVSGVNAADFALTVTGSVSGATLGPISGGPSSYTVTVNTGGGSGTLRLDLIDDGTIVDGVGNKLGGTGAGNGNFTTGEVYTLNQPLPAPANLIAGAGDGKVVATWNAVPGATGYNLKRSLTAGGPYTTIAPNIATNTFTDTAVTNGTRYFYVVTTLDGANESGNSLEQRATPNVPAALGLVISQVYGGGGNTGAPLTNDFIEVFNRGNGAVNVNGWSVQYVSAAGTGAWTATAINGQILPGHYFLVQEAAGTNSPAPLPAPDASGGIAMASGAGKVALVSSTATLTGCAPSSTIADFVGYGSTASCFEGAGPTATLTNTTAALRQSGGCKETQSNTADFSTGAPTPRNSASAPNNCGLSAVAAFTPSTVPVSTATLITADVAPALAPPPPSSGITVTANLTAIGGSATQALVDDGTSGDVTAGDGIFSFSATVGAATSAGAKTIPVTVADAQARTSTTAAIVNVTPGVEPIADVKVDASPADTVPDRIGQVVQVRGIVTSIDFNGGSGIEYFIQDATGGIDIFSSSAFGPFTIGQQIEVTGTVTQFSGLTELTASAATVVGSGSVTPLTVTLAGINESLEGQLVRVDNLTMSPATFAGDTNYVISDGTAGELRVDADTNIVGTNAPTGVFSLVGLVSQHDTSNPFDSGYQILPRSTADIIPRTAPTGVGSSTPPSVAPGQQTTLKVTVTLGQNPVSTGVSVVADLSAIGGSPTQAFFDDGSNGDASPGDNVFSFLATVSISTSIGAKSMPATITDGQARSSATTIPLNVQSASAPPVPLNLVATPGNHQVGLTWDASAGATGYNVKRSLTAGGPYATISSNQAGTSYTDNAVTNGTRYYYVVSALNGASESGDSAEANALPSAPPPSGSLARVYFVDIGQGAGTLIVGPPPTNKTLLIDAGETGKGNSKVIPLLNTLGIATIDNTIVTHYHVDHDAGMTEVINAGRVAGTAYDNGDGPTVIPPVITNSTGTAYTAYKNALASHSGTITRQTINPGTVIDLGGGMKATCLVAGGRLLGGTNIFISQTDLNSESISTLIQYNDFDFLISGDLTGGGSTTTAKTPDVETFVAQLAGDVDVVQLDHHGSTTANNRRFLGQLKAETSLASAGATNTFGHPNRETVNKYLNIPVTSGNTYPGTGIPGPGNGPVFYQTDPSPVGDTRCTLQGYSGADQAHAGQGTILLKTDGTTSFTMESFDDGGVRIPASAHVYDLDSTGAGVMTNFPPTVVPNLVPGVPLASETATVQANVADAEDVITSVTLNYSLNGAAQAPVMMVPNSGIFEATIPPQPNGTRVDYTITAVAGGASTSFSNGYFSGITPISSLRVLNALGEPQYLDYAARVQATTLAGTGSYSASTNDDYVSDATGALNVFRTIEPTSPAPQPTSTGNTYTIAGLIGQNLGRLRLEVTPPFDGIDKPWAAAPGSYNPYQIALVSAGGAPVPEVKTIAQILANPEGLEAHLIRIDNCTVTSGTIPASDNGIDSFLTITDGTGSLQLKIDHDTDIPGLATPSGTFSVTGTLQQDDPLRPFDSLYDIAPRNRTDLGAAAGGPSLITIADARADVDATTGLTPDDYVPDRLNQTVKVRGVVTSVDFRGAAGMEIYIQDPTGGVDIFNTSNPAAPSIGDSVEVVGQVQQFNGLTEINPGTSAASVVTLPAGTMPPVSPQVVTLSQIGDGPGGETHEGLLLRINNVTLVSPPATFAANTNYVIQDATGTGTIRIDGDTDIDGTAPPSGTFSIIGVLGQFDSSSPLDSGYQFFPRIRASDFLPAVATPAAIQAIAGTPQSTLVNTAFATQLQAKVTDSGNNGIEGVGVVFTAPGAGASGTFAGGSTTANVTTDASGIATAPVFTANSVSGTYNVTATINSLTASFSLTNLDPPSQPTATHLGFTAPSSATVGTPFNVTVTALDGSEATVASYTGTVHFTSSSGATVPPDYT
ncbi:MAG TPA: DUF5689 domain-containing protein, partial [Thermoanaerobaculia bacterium]|nr:DUF5689 domain-containing protein [Thermoanaerobaculia bacterium]